MFENLKEVLKDIGKDPEVQEKIKETKNKIAKAFADLGAPIPDEMESEVEVSKFDEKMIHVGVQHLYMGVVNNLEASKEHLLKLNKKYGENNNLAISIIPMIDLLLDETKNTVDLIAKNVNEMPTSKELKELFINLEKEAQNAAVLEIMNVEVPKAKMH